MTSSAELTSLRLSTNDGSESGSTPWARYVRPVFLCTSPVAHSPLLLPFAVTFIVAIVAVVERTRISSAKTGLALSTVLGFSQACTMLIRQQAEVENNLNSSERLMYFANSTPKEAPAFIEETAPPKEWPAQGAISVRHAEVRYRPELPPVLHDVSIDIKAGEKVGVVGRTGAGTLRFPSSSSYLPDVFPVILFLSLAGKSTLLQALFRIIELSKGQIEIDGVDISKIGLAQLRQRLAIIPQEPLLFHGTIRCV
jgi:ATP-binding cassette subfamily C (CFTR/MRP) protein 1